MLAVAITPSTDRSIEPISTTKVTAVESTIAIEADSRIASKLAILRNWWLANEKMTINTNKIAAGPRACR